MSTSHGRPVVALLLPKAERDPVVAELHAGGFNPIPLDGVRELAALLATRPDVAVGIIDAEVEADLVDDAWTLLHSGGRSIPALLIVNPTNLDALNFMGEGHEDDEYLTRPYSAESIRWRVEAMCIRSVAVDDGSGPVLQGELEASDWSRRGQLIAAVQPQGRRRQDDDRHQPVGDAGPQGPPGPADRRRHGHRSRQHLARDGRRADRRRRLARRARGRARPSRSSTSRRPTPRGCGSSRCRPAPSRRRSWTRTGWPRPSRSRAGPWTSSSWTSTRHTARSTARCSTRRSGSSSR